MWEMCDSEKKPREFKARFSHNKPCGLCKTHFRTDDMFYIIIIPNALRGSHARLKDNMFVHVDEWDEICKGVSTDDELAEKIIKSKFKKKNILTTDEQSRIEAFKKACMAYNFKMEVSKPYGVRMRQRGSSVYVDYNVYMDMIEVDYRGRRGLFDGFYQKQIVTNIYNEMHKILADGKHSDYNYKDSINQVLNEVNETMKEIF